VSTRVHWSYVQARLQARHGARLDESGWRIVEGAKSLDQFLERTRTTALRRFIERMDAGMSSHAIERDLRAQWRRYGAEVAAWVPPAWKPAVTAVARIPDLPMLAALDAGDAPDWTQHDPALARRTESGTGSAAFAAFPGAAPAAQNGSSGTSTGRWLAHWRASWPLPRTSDWQRLDDLVDLVSAHAARLGNAGAQDTSSRYRGDLMRALTRLFRRHGFTPAAVFAHLALVALDLERLRGGLVRRRLFAAESTEPIA